MPMKSSDGKQVALVTGASRGIGRAIAVALAESGRHVIVNYKSNADAAGQTLALVEQSGGSGDLAPFDVADFEATDEALRRIYEKHPRIDILVNNAGVIRDMLLPFMKEEDWNYVLDTNLNGFFNVTRTVVKQMLLKRAGRIVNITSVAGQMGSPGQVNYAASKAGLIGATMSLAREVGKRGITVNAVSPGFTETEMLAGLPLDVIKNMVPMQRLGRPEEVASAVVYLCSPLAGYITGQVIGVNGGIC